ncbi:ATP-binding protein [Actinomadura sp.]|uniref:ATP-binding protein n=1 Tax=Actinomadura sp. TaxID=1989 RepID=UPI0037C8CEAC
MPAAGAAAFVDGERGEQDRRRRECDDRPPGPSRLAALDERIDQRRHAAGGEHGPEDVQRGWTIGLGLRHQRERAGQREDTDRDVDQEDRPPAEAEHVVRHECAAQQRPGDSTGGRVTVSLSGGGDFYLLEVADDGAGGGRPRVKGETGAEGGRGLRIVAALAEAWGFRTDGDRTIVWARFPSPCGILSANTDRGLSERSRTLVPTAFEGGQR